MRDQLPEPLAGVRILVAEDELLTLMMLQEMLEELGAHVVGSVKTREAVLSKLDETSPDVVTLDVNFCGHPIYDVAISLQDRGVPFVFVSGYSSLPDCPERLATVPCVGKPFRLHELAGAIKKILNKTFHD